MTERDEKIVAAIDLGSNSFHMVIARISDAGVQVIGKIKQRVRLAAGLDEANRLDEAAMQRGLEALQLFADRLQGFAERDVRIVATQTLRVARNAEEFERRARVILDYPIEIISGIEEARLIYQGVAHTTHEPGRKLVVDIGGGSTELIIGEGFVEQAISSRKMGSVSFTNKFFGNGKLGEKRLNAALLTAEHQLENISQGFRSLGWQTVIGTSGSARAIQQVLTGGEQQPIRRDALEQLLEQLMALKNVEQLDLPGLPAERQPLFAASVAILTAIFRQLDIDEMATSDAALREGVLYETEERLRHHDIRERTANALASRYQLDQEQARQVRTLALALFDQLQAAWSLPAELRSLLGWAAQLHEVGLQINFGGIHRHSAYILANSNLPGFSQEQQSLLSFLVGAQRKGLKQLLIPQSQLFTEKQLLRILRLLRLAVLLYHRRQPLDTEVAASAKGARLTLTFAPNWLQRNVLVERDLQREAQYGQQQQWELKFC